MLRGPAGTTTRIANRLRAVPFPLGALFLVVAINITAFVMFPRIGAAVGAATGTDGYDGVAASLVQGDGFVFSAGRRSTGMTGYMKREPVYPLFLAGILRLTGTMSPVVLCIFQTGLSVIACCFVYALAKNVFDNRTGRLTSYIYAFHPVSFWYSARFASEMIAVPVCLLALLAIVRLLDFPSRAAAMRAGAMVGVAALTKSAFVVAPPLLIVFMLVRARQQMRQSLPIAIVVIACYAGVHSLWLIRNYALAGEIVPFTTMNGFSFFVGKKIFEEFDVKKQTAGSVPDRWAAALYRSVQNEIAAAEPGISMPRLEARTDARLIGMAQQLAIEDPLFVLRKMLAGTVLIWYLSDTTAKSFGWMIFQLPLVILAMVGIYRQHRWTPSKCFLICFTATYVLSYALVSPLARYGMILIPILMLFAGNALTVLFRAGAGREHSPALQIS